MYYGRGRGVDGGRLIGATRAEGRGDGGRGMLPAAEGKRGRWDFIMFGPKERELQRTIKARVGRSKLLAGHLVRLAPGIQLLAAWRLLSITEQHVVAEVRWSPRPIGRTFLGSSSASIGVPRRFTPALGGLPRVSQEPSSAERRPEQRTTKQVFGRRGGEKLNKTKRISRKIICYFYRATAWKGRIRTVR